MLRCLSRGFTLIEVLVATGILVTVAAGTAQLTAIAMHHDAATRQQLAMSALAFAKLDEISATLARGAPPAAASGALDRDAEGFTDVAESAGAPFRRRWTIAPLAAWSATAAVIVVRIVPLSGPEAPGLEIATIADAGGS
jgi:prepilin-type N-terminal cleavage/methylation domain-containing protein